MTDIRMYLVGGAVRDGLLGVRSKDLDYVAVVDPELGLTIEESFDFMAQYLEDTGMTIFLRTPEFQTIRARFNGKGTDTADFVLARKEGPYTDGRHPDWVVPGTLEDDIFRRDFTINALAKDGLGNIIDLVGGQADLEARILRAVGDPTERLKEDALRVFRAVRFSITKGFRVDDELRDAMSNLSVLDALENNIAAERIKDELHKCFAFNSAVTMRTLVLDFPALLGIIHHKGIWMEPTLKSPGGKRPVKEPVDKTGCVWGKQ